MVPMSLPIKKPTQLLSLYNLMHRITSLQVPLTAWCSYQVSSKSIEGLKSCRDTVTCMSNLKIIITENHLSFKNVKQVTTYSNLRVPLFLQVWGQWSHSRQLHYCKSWVAYMVVVVIHLLCCTSEVSWCIWVSLHQNTSVSIANQADLCRIRNNHNETQKFKKIHAFYSCISSFKECQCQM